MRQASPKSQSASHAQISIGCRLPRPRHRPGNPLSSITNKTGAHLGRAYTGATMKRPIPVVLTAILLGLMAALQLLFAVLMIAVGFIVLKQGMPPSAGPQPFPPSMMPALMFGMSVLFAAFAVWFILTLIGLVRLRSWARYSLLVIAGLMAAFGGISMLTSFAMPFLMPTLPATAGQPPPDPGQLRMIFFAAGAF